MRGEEILRGEKYEIVLDGGKEPSWGHRFKNGEIVIADKPDVNGGGTDWNNWRFVSIDHQNSWWVNVSDIRPIYDPTQDEIERLFGIQPQPHCTTCTCHQD